MHNALPLCSECQGRHQPGHPCSDKSGWLPPEQRKREHAPLEPSEIEYLERLVEAGEGLLLEGSFFSQAKKLLKEGYAEKVANYMIGGATIHRIAPTEAGRQLAAIRKKAKLERAR